jgi:hypothetical protein
MEALLGGASTLSPLKREILGFDESGWRESNPHDQLGRLGLYH